MFGYVVINVPTRTSEFGPIFHTKFKGILHQNFANSLTRMCLWDLSCNKMDVVFRYHFIFDVSSGSPIKDHVKLLGVELMDNFVFLYFFLGKDFGITVKNKIGPTCKFTFLKFLTLVIS